MVTAHVGPLVLWMWSETHFAKVNKIWLLEINKINATPCELQDNFMHIHRSSMGGFRLFDRMLVVGEGSSGGSRGACSAMASQIEIVSEPFPLHRANWWLIIDQWVRTCPSEKNSLRCTFKVPPGQGKNKARSATHADRMSVGSSDGYKGAGV